MIGMKWMNRAPALVAEEVVDVASEIAVRDVHRRQGIPRRELHRTAKEKKRNRKLRAQPGGMRAQLSF